MTRFRPCIDLHQGQVKQIVGGSLRDDGVGPRENFVSEMSPEYYAALFRDDDLLGGHVIKLGAGNDEAAMAALTTWKQGLQLGGGIHLGNAKFWIDCGASHVIVTSALFDERGAFRQEQAQRFADTIGPDKLVIDLSCRKTKTGWVVAMNRWQTLTDLELNHATLDRLAPFCDEFLIHAADVEGLCGGVDRQLVELLGSWSGRPLTYAGGATSMSDLDLIQDASSGKLDVTVGSALDLFGGKGMKYRDLVNWNLRSEKGAPLS